MLRREQLCPHRRRYAARLRPDCVGRHGSSQLRLGGPASRNASRTIRLTAGRSASAGGRRLTKRESFPPPPSSPPRAARPPPPEKHSVAGFEKVPLPTPVPPAAAQRAAFH